VRIRRPAHSASRNRKIYLADDLSITFVMVKSLPFKLETFSPLGAVSFPSRFPVMVFDFFAPKEFALTVRPTLA